MTPQDREAARAQAERQAAIGKRTEDVAGEAARKLGGMPGMEKAECELKGASRACARRENRCAATIRRARPPPSATPPTGWPSCAIRCRTGRWAPAASRHEPVRIPGADESTAPRAWRQELLDAMKEKAPERFRDEVRRYYEELVR